MLILDIETEENLQCGITTSGGAKGGGSGPPTSGFKSASAVVDAAIKKAIEDGKGGKATVSRGAELRAKFGNAEKALEKKYPDRFKSGEAPTRIEKNLAAGVRNRSQAQVTSEFRKAKAITRSEADDKTIQKSLDRRARKTGKDVVVNTRISPDKTSAQTTYKFQVKGSSVKGGDIEMRRAAQRTRQSKAAVTTLATRKSNKPSTIKSTARKQLSAKARRKTGAKVSTRNSLSSLLS